MKRDNRFLKSILGFMNRVREDHVGAYAAQAAYFLILSFIPFVLFFTTIIKYTPLTYEVMIECVARIVPNELQSYVMGIVKEVYHRNTALMPITAITTLWSAGKGTQAVSNGLNTIYHVAETRNWLMTRIYCMFYTLIFVIAIISCLVVLVMGKSFGTPLMKYVPLLSKLIRIILGFQNIWGFLILVLIFTFLYRFLPNKRLRIIRQIPGALITSAAWMISSYLFSLYFTIWPSFENMYGSVAAIIMVMLWLYMCMNILLYGAEINSYFENDFRKAQHKAREMFEKNDSKEGANKKKNNKS